MMNIRFYLSLAMCLHMLFLIHPRLRKDGKSIAVGGAAINLIWLWVL